jgi:phosphatidylglycerol:prolipoprotein diacylglycerol transferase
MLPKLIEVGGFFLPTYGVLVALGFLAGLWVASRLARRSGLDPDRVVNLGVYGALAGLAGAKLFMFVIDWNYYSRNPGELFSLSTLQTGGVFYGGLIAALIAGVLMLRRWKMPAAATLDCLAPGAALGQAIGRIGCFAAGCCWGVACDRPWAVTFTNPDARKLVGVPLDVAVHPTQLYEAVLGLLVFAVLWRLAHRHPAPGAVLGWYLVMNSVARFAVEFFRHHDQPNPFGGPLSAQQWVSIGLAVLGIVVLRGRRSAAPVARTA